MQDVEPRVSIAANVNADKPRGENLFMLQAG
jgi:hypothetical protein